jgi:hypothetical protein
MGRRRGVLFLLFGRHMMADDAAADRSGDGVVAGIVAGDAADHRALKAPGGLRRPWKKRRRERHAEGGGDEEARSRIHEDFLFFRDAMVRYGASGRGAKVANGLRLALSRPIAIRRGGAYKGAFPSKLSI